MEILKVSSNTKVNSLAGAIAGTIREAGMNKKLYDWLFADIEEIIDMTGEQNG